MKLNRRKDECITSQTTHSICPSSLGAMPAIGGSQWHHWLCLYQCFWERQTALPQAVSVPFKYTVESKRKWKLHVNFFTGLLGRGGILVSAAKVGCCCGKNNNCKKMFTADQWSQYMELHLASCSLLRHVGGNGINQISKIRTSERTRIKARKSGYFPHMEIVPSVQCWRSGLDSIKQANKFISNRSLENIF